MTLPEYTAIVSLVFMTIILAVGLLGNLMVIIVILTAKETGNRTEGGRSTHLFLLNLAIVDLLILVVCTSSTLVEIATRRDDWIMGKVNSEIYCTANYIIWLYYNIILFG